MDNGAKNDQVLVEDRIFFGGADAVKDMFDYEEAILLF